MRPRSLIALPVVFSLCSNQFSGSARAAPLFYEGFFYPSGEDALRGQTAVSGLWTEVNSGASANVADGSLGYRDALGNTLKTHGNKVFVDSSEEAAQVDNRLVIDVASNAEPGGQTRWLSFIMKKETESLRFAGVSLLAPDNTFEPADGGTSLDEILAVGVNTGQTPQNFRIQDRAGVSGSSGVSSSFSAYQQSFLLVKVELNADGLRERFTLWVNPALCREPDAAEGFSFTSLNSDLPDWRLSHLRLAAGNANASGPATSFWVDEIRIGETFADVTPHEPAFSLAMAPAGEGQWTFRWPAKADRLDVVEFSRDGQVWLPLPGTERSGYVLPLPAEHTATVSLPAVESRFFFRARREF